MIEIPTRYHRYEVMAEVSSTNRASQRVLRKVGSWQSAVTVALMIVVMVVLANCQSEQQAEKVAQAQQETQAVREFTNWVKSQPDGKRLYDKYYNR